MSDRCAPSHVRINIMFTFVGAPSDQSALEPQAPMAFNRGTCYRCHISIVEPPSGPLFIIHTCLTRLDTMSGINFKDLADRIMGGGDREPVTVDKPKIIL